MISESSAMHQLLLKLEGISKQFPGVKALDNVSLEVAPGEILGGGSGMGSGGLAASFHEVVEAQGADRVHEAHMDAALGDGLAFGVEAGGFVNGDVANGAGWEDALGADDVEGAGFIEAIEGIDAGNPGEDAAFFFEGEEGSVSFDGFDRLTTWEEFAAGEELDAGLASSATDVKRSADHRFWRRG